MSAHFLVIVIIKMEQIMVIGIILSEQFETDIDNELHYGWYISN